MAAGNVSVLGVKVAPHSLQNLEAAALPCPQPGHASNSGAPHWLQNLLPLGRSALQVGHSIDASRCAKLKSSAWHLKRHCVCFLHLGAIGCFEMRQVCSGYRWKST